MFQIKNFNSIVASMINRIVYGSSTLTDFNVGSTLRSILESVANEIDFYYQALLKGFYEAVPVAIYRSFNFRRLSASASSNYVTFTRETGNTKNIIIPAGTQVSIPGSNFNFITQDNAELQSGTNTINVYVVASTTGMMTNCLVNSITEMVDSITGIASVTNNNPFINGTDQETDSERKLRFQKWLNTLSKGTRGAIEYGVSIVKLYNENGNITEEVKKFKTYEPCIDDDPAGATGTINVYIWNGSNGASAELIAETNKTLLGYTDSNGKKIPGWKGAGILCPVDAVTPVMVNITATITMDGTRTQTDIENDVNSAIATLFSALDVGGTLVLAQLEQAIMNVVGVNDLSISAPATNVDASAVSSYSICSPGTVSLTYA